MQSLAMILFARIAILDPALWTILSQKPHLDCVSNKFGMYFHHEVFLHVGRFRMDSEV